MSGIHKYPTISFRISPREREEIEAKIGLSVSRGIKGNADQYPGSERAV